MLEDQGLEEGLLGWAEPGERSHSFLKHDISEELLALLNKLGVILAEFQNFLRVILKLDLGASFGKCFTALAESKSEVDFSLMLPAVRVAFDRLTVRDRLADCLDVSESALTVESDFCLARCVLWAGLVRVTALQAPMLAVLHGCVAASAATFLHELVLPTRWIALARQMADFFTDVTTSEVLPTHLTTGVLRLTAVHVGHDLGAAVAHLGDDLQAGRAVAHMTPKRALMTTRVNFTTRTRASRYWGIAHDWWVSFGGSTRAIKRLS